MAMVDSEKFIKNPINCFLLIKQLTIDFQELFQSVRRTNELTGKLLNSHYLLSQGFKDILKLQEM
jgi:hypothetical protein